MKETCNIASKNIIMRTCGEGIFAGWLLENEQIDVLKLKINPLLLGKGVKLFGNSTKSYKLTLLDSEMFEEGLLINSYKIRYKGF